MAMTQTDLELKASIKRVYEVITDFESYPEFLSGSKAVKTLKKNGKSLQVEFQLEVVKTITYSLEIQLNPPKGFSWKLIKGDFMKSNSGLWDLKELKKELTLAHYEIDLNLGFLVPKSVSSMLIEKSLPQMMREFKERVES